MAKPGYDGVVEAVRYQPDGRLAWVRGYLRRGPVFTDCLIIHRQALIEHLKSGKRIMVGRRVPYMAGTFEVSRSIKLLQKDGEVFLTTDDLSVQSDHLEGVPVI